MTCYQRHLGELFEALGVPYDASGRRRVDDAIRRAFGMRDSDHCPQVWAAVKGVPIAELVERVRAELG